MQKNGVGIAAFKNMPVVAVFRTDIVEYMAEKLLTECLEQEILCLKMRIEGGSAYIRLIDDLTDCDLTEGLLRQKGGKCFKYSFSGFSLSAIHTVHSFRIVR